MDRQQMIKARIEAIHDQQIYGYQTDDKAIKKIATADVDWFIDKIQPELDERERIIRIAESRIKTLEATIKANGGQRVMDKPIKVIEFKTISPFFEQERDGIKPFTTRMVDMKDERYQVLYHFGIKVQLNIKITNPATGESFEREVTGWSVVHVVNITEWVNIFFKELK